MVKDIGYLAGLLPHGHSDQDDTLFALEGVLAARIDDEVVDLGPGDFATVPPGVRHTFDNIRKDQPSVRVCNLMTPGGLTGGSATWRCAARTRAARCDAGWASARLRPAPSAS